MLSLGLKFAAWRQFKTLCKCCKFSSHEALYINVPAMYAKQKSKPGNTCDVMKQNTPCKEQILTSASFQCHFPLVSFLALPQVSIHCDDIKISDLMNRRFYSSIILLIGLLCSARDNMKYPSFHYVWLC